MFADCLPVAAGSASLKRFVMFRARKFVTSGASGAGIGGLSVVLSCVFGCRRTDGLLNDSWLRRGRGVRLTAQGQVSRCADACRSGTPSSGQLKELGAVGAVSCVKEWMNVA